MTSVPSQPQSALADALLTSAATKPPKPAAAKPALAPRFNSIGTKLFIAVMAGALAGLGGISFLFYQTLSQQAERQVQDALKTEVNGIESQLAPVSQTAQNISVAVDSLKAAKVTDIEAYKSTVLGFYHQRPKLAMATYFLQAPNGIVASRQWFGPYFYTDQKSPDQVGVALPPPNQGVIYSDLYADDNYPTREYYTLPVKAERAVWMEPYIWYKIPMTSFVRPNYDAQNKLTAVTGLDVNINSLSKSIRDSVINNAGYFALVSAKGSLISYPPDPSKAEKIESYAKVPQLKAIWSKVQSGQSGLIVSDGNLLAYRRVPSTNWLMLAVVPESVVTLPVLGITAAGTLAAAAILAIVVALVARQINRRLQPILAECDKLAATDAQTQGKLQQEDEIGQLSVCFFNLLDQLTVKEEKLRQESEQRLQLAAQAQEENEVLQSDVGHILDVVSAVEEGDLTVEAEVSDRATGLVADTLNRLIEELSRIMSTVIGTAQQVAGSADDLEQQASTVAQQVQRQTQSVAEVQHLMTNVNDLSQDTAEQTVIANTAVQQAQVAVAQGREGLGLMTHGITDLQEGAGQIVRRVQTLTDFVDLAAQFSKDQKRVAALTRVLALNASMIAARASGQQDPEQFASVAKEFATIAGQVNDLAVQTNQGLLLLQQRTDQIQTEVSGLNQDAEGIDTLVGQFTASVDQSRQAFENIKTATEQVAQVGQQVSQSSQAIAAAAQTTLVSIEDIAAVTRTTEGQSQFTQEQANLMGQLVQRLLNRVEFFQLSAEPTPQPPSQEAVDVPEQAALANGHGVLL
jgi:methyl-accepting chemotaxis protein PixJ